MTLSERETGGHQIKCGPVFRLKSALSVTPLSTAQHPTKTIQSASRS